MSRRTGPKGVKSSVVLDGGLIENIPVISTYTTLHNEYGIQPEDIDMFVIGTGDFIVDKTWTASEVNSWSVLSMMKNLLIPYLTDSNEQTSVFWRSPDGLQLIHILQSSQDFWEDGQP